MPRTSFARLARRRRRSRARSAGRRRRRVAHVGVLRRPGRRGARRDVVIALGYVAMGWALAYLGVGHRARRRRRCRSSFVYLPIVAGILQALSAIVFIVRDQLVDLDFLAGRRTVDAGRRHRHEPAPPSSRRSSACPGALGLALSVVLISLNAMRIGLLTRFLGVLGMIVGALLVPSAARADVVLAFWLSCSPCSSSASWPTASRRAWTSGKRGAVADLGRRPRAAPEGARRRARASPAPRSRSRRARGRRRGPSPSASATKRKRKRRWRSSSS